MKKLFAAFLCGVGVTIITVALLGLASNLWQAYKSRPAQDAFTEAVVNENYDALGYKLIPFSEIAEQLDNEIIEAHDNIHYLDDAPWVPDWGYYNNAELVEREVLEYSSYYSGVESHSRYYFYDRVNSDDDAAVAAYIRILYQAGYELKAIGLDRIVYHRDGMYIRLMQVQDVTYRRISVSTSDSGFGV